MSKKEDYRSVIVFLFSLALIFLICGFFGYFYTMNERYEYGVIVDISSFNIEFNLYKWSNSKRVKKTASIIQKWNILCDINVHHPDYKFDQLKEDVFDCVRHVTEPLDGFELYNSTIFIYGTELTRLLCKTDRNKCDGIFRVFKEVLNAFDMTVFDNETRSLEGFEEAAYGWISVNEYYDNLRKSSGYKYGALDLKNYSLLISLDVNKSVSNLTEKHSYEVFGNNYELITHDLMCLGLNQFYNLLLLDMIMTSPTQTLIKHPCHASGYSFKLKTNTLWNPCLSSPQTKLKDSYDVIGEWNEQTCLNKIVSSINKRENINNNSLNLIKNSLIGMDKKFLGFSRFGEIAKIYNSPTTNLQEYYNSHIKGCENVINDYNTGCFDLIYSYYLVTTVLGINSKNIIIEPSSNIETLTGAMVHNSKYIPTRLGGSLIGNVGFVSVMFSVLVFTLFGIFMFNKYKLIAENNSKL